MDKTDETKKFKSYQTRSITLSDDAWNKLKEAKLKVGKNWNKFIIELLEKK